jgi:molybdopterin synthase catalytic subunit
VVVEMFKKIYKYTKVIYHIEKIHNSWYEKYKNLNYGAFITFVGVVRDENGIDGLSFDIYEPILNSWFSSWQEKAKTRKCNSFYGS